MNRSYSKERTHLSLYGAVGKSYSARRAFSLPEVIVALTIVMVVAAVALPNLAGHLDQKRIDATASLLAEVRDGLSSPGTGFRQVVNANAGQLSELTAQIWNANSGIAPFPTNSCGANFTNGQVNSWDNAGPYLGFFIPATGLVTPIGVANDVLQRIPNSATAGVVRIVIPNVAESDATMLDETVDGGGGAATGTILWDPPAAGIVTLRYQMPINNRC
ncbi:MAG: type II secretion system protein [Gemmatimonadaceae bacterium]